MNKPEMKSHIYWGLVEKKNTFNRQITRERAFRNILRSIA
jgi:hypothetical protein